MSEQNIYQFTVRKSNGEEVSLSEYRNKVLLIVNIASECGFTPQLKDMETLRREINDPDFEILAFPSNDFGHQTPLEGDALSKFCCINYHTKFKVFGEINVRGSKAHPLYRFLGRRKANGGSSLSPKWNFHKFLVNRDGEVEDYYLSFTRPDSERIKRRIRNLLQFAAQPA